MPLSDNYKSVFVIGAGASAEYDYPMGSKLTTLISESLIPSQSLFKIVQEETHDPDIINEFREKFIYSEVFSIDAFLKRTVNKNPKYLIIGKIVIAALLLKCETRETMFRKAGYDFHWLRHFFNLLDEDLKGDWAGLPEDKFYFISFNYDRTIEYYLYMKLKNLYDFSDTQINNIVSKLNITHVHGHLGKLPFQGDTGFQYYHVLSQERIMKATESIRIAYETMDGDIGKVARIHQIQGTIKSAYRLFFLGFSYHPDNMEILNLEGSRSGRTVYGSGYGMSATRNQEIVRDHGVIHGLNEKSTIQMVMNTYGLW